MDRGHLLIKQDSRLSRVDNLLKMFLTRLRLITVKPTNTFTLEGLKAKQIQ